MSTVEQSIVDELKLSEDDIVIMESLYAVIEEKLKGKFPLEDYTLKKDSDENKVTIEKEKIKFICNSFSPSEEYNCYEYVDKYIFKDIEASRIKEKMYISIIPPKKADTLKDLLEYMVDNQDESDNSECTKKKGCLQYMFWQVYSYVYLIQGRKEKPETLKSILEYICACAAKLKIEKEELIDTVLAVFYQYNYSLDAPVYISELGKELYNGLSSAVEKSEKKEHINNNMKEYCTEKYCNYLKAGYHIIIVDTLEENEAIDVIRNAAKKFDGASKIYEWNIADGLFNIESNVSRMEGCSLEEMIDDLLVSARDVNNNCIYIVRTAESYVNNPNVIGKIKILSDKIKVGNDKGKKNYVFIISRNICLDSTIEKYVYLDNSIGYPDEQEIKELINVIVKQENNNMNTDDMISKCKGLTRNEIERVINLALVKSKEGDNTKAMQTLILEEKKQIIKKSNLVELVDTESIPKIGGLEALNDWIEIKSKIINNPIKAMENKVDVPKGVLLIGMPGCGKSLSAKTMANRFNVPLLKIELGSLLNKYLGESEHNFRDALKLAEAISPCVLWVDELEKAFQGDKNNSQSESSSRILGYMLNWMQEKKSSTFVMATANNVKKLPPELLRKGRFDEVFFVDLPNEKERQLILKYHLESKGISYEDIEDIASKMKDFSGAEIEWVVRTVAEKRFMNIIDKKDAGYINEKMFIDAINETIPLYTTMHDEVDEMREFCRKSKFRNASKK